MEVCGEKGIGSGRHVRSRSRITEGTLIWSEPALVTGPRLSHVLVCVQCLRSLKTLSQCSKCGLSICDECSAKEMNGNIATTLRGLTPHSVECSFLTSHRVMLNRKRNKTEAKLLQPLVTILRLLLTDGWSELEGNVSKRKGSKSWNFTEKNIIPHLQNIRDLNHNNIFSKDDIHLAAGILDTNCFDLKCDKKVGRCIFLSTSMFNNNCEPNCVRKIEDCTVRIIAARDISAGEELTICYADTSLPTNVRQEIFSTTKHFYCTCTKCTGQL